MIEKRVLMAALLSALVLAGYSQMMARWYPQPQRAQSTQSVPQAPSSAKSAASPAQSTLQHIGEEELITIESEDLVIEIGSTSGAIRTATLKKFGSGRGNGPLRFSSMAPLLRPSINGMDSVWSVENITSSSASFNVIASSGIHYHISYVIDELNPVVKLSVYSIGTLQHPVQLDIASAWARADDLSSRNNSLEAILLTEISEQKTKYEKHIAPAKKEKSVPRGTLIATLSERYFCSSLKPTAGNLTITLLPSTAELAAYIARVELTPDATGRVSYAADLYLGPRDYFYMNRAKFSKAIPVGMIGQIGLAFLIFLGWIGRITGNYGVAVIVFSACVSAATAPFTLMSLRSMKKMQHLKPQIDKIMSAHKSDPQKANAEVFQLYKHHKVNPLSGCLPMLLQMPIFIALFQAISHYIELRGKSFLWIDDLSLPDRLAILPFSIPLLGSEVNILPIIMAGAMYLQSKLSQGNMTIDKSNPAASMMSGPTMSIVFGVMFYHFPAGLVLYWLTNSMMSILWYRLVK
jgi:YidC/Oxa1 family membrane protein insertase